jgi:hypothetical protein
MKMGNHMKSEGIQQMLPGPRPRQRTKNQLLVTGMIWLIANREKPPQQSGTGRFFRMGTSNKNCLQRPPT